VIARGIGINTPGTNPVKLLSPLLSYVV